MSRSALLIAVACVALLVAGVSVLGHILALPWPVSAALSAAVAGVVVYVTRPDSRSADSAREELLRAVVETAPMAVLVYGETGRISFSNEEARRLFAEGNALDGENFLKLLGQ